MEQTKIISNRVKQVFVLRETSEAIKLKNQWYKPFLEMAKKDNPNIETLDDHDFLHILHDLLPLVQNKMISREWKEDTQGRFMIFEF